VQKLSARDALTSFSLFT